ncbi:hypothetical protein BR93DRAFT_435927 [Coniochaeta sp. PMI_546]|nr:hypothetical protein BR93DRAFT_435927 [Coniochaeta sp. PMI_546]
MKYLPLPKLTLTSFTVCVQFILVRVLRAISQTYPHIPWHPAICAFVTHLCHSIVLSLHGEATAGGVIRRVTIEVIRESQHLLPRTDEEVSVAHLPPHLLPDARGLVGRALNIRPAEPAAVGEADVPSVRELRHREHAEGALTLAEHLGGRLGGHALRAGGHYLRYRVGVVREGQGVDVPREGEDVGAEAAQEDGNLGKDAVHGEDDVGYHPPAGYLQAAEGRVGVKLGLEVGVYVYLHRLGIEPGGVLVEVMRLEGSALLESLLFEGLLLSCFLLGGFPLKGLLLSSFLLGEVLLAGLLREEMLFDSLPASLPFGSRELFFKSHIGVSGH